MERFNRLINLIEENTFNDLKIKTILIVGLGGVGGYTFESLVRLGIENFIIIDHDIVDITNINRQLIASNKTIGQKKVAEYYNRALSINPQVNISQYDLFLSEDNIKLLNDYKIDYIVDACDTISTKVSLINYALKNHIKIISCMGTGNRLDATKINITRLDKTINDPLAKSLRHALRKENITTKIPVIASIELPKKSQSKVIASNSYVPAVAGLYVTNYILNDIMNIT